MRSLSRSSRQREADEPEAWFSLGLKTQGSTEMTHGNEEGLPPPRLNRDGRESSGKTIRAERVTGSARASRWPSVP
jgi:hypothetical protein